MTRNRSRARLATLAVAGLLAAACGSTVQTTAQQPGAVLAPDGQVVPSAGATAGADAGLSVPGTTSSTGSAPGAAAGATTYTGPGTAGTTAGSGATTTRTGGGSATTTVGGPVGPGITDEKVYVGLAYSSDAAAGNRAIGAAGAAQSYDGRDYYNSVIHYANSHGGFAGRQLEPVYFDFSVSQDKSSQDQAACAKWTQDNKVFAMYAFRSDTIRTCAEKAGGVSLVSGDGIKSTFERFPHFLDPNSIRLDRMGGVTVGGLAKAGYFRGKLGLVTWDDPNYKFAMQHGYLPALTRQGIKPTLDPVYISVPQQLGAIGDMTAAVSSAVTKFRAAGIDHVIIQDGPAGVWAGGGLTLEWMNQAKSQNYYPRYGQNAYNLPGNSVLPADQMDHAIAILSTDDDKKYDEGWHLNKAREKCFKIMADAGFPISSSNSTDESLASQACDMVFFIQQVVNSLRESITADSFVRGAEALGTSFASAYVYGTKLGPNRHDGADMVRTAEYLQSCKCLKYKGPPYYPD